MSHFSVLVITETPDQVEHVLQPFHEYECTGTKDEYVVFVEADETREELEKEWNQDDYDTFEIYLKEYHGYKMEGDKIGRHTNPNAKWDWWVIGGRWSGFLKPAEQGVGEKGKAGLMGAQYDENGVDVCMKSSVDFDGRMKEAAELAAVDYDKASKIIDGRDWLSWKDCLAQDGTMDEKREQYHAQQVIKDMREVNDNPFFSLDKYQVGRDKFIEQAANESIATFAVVKDGEWYERGEMGWFGCVGSEKDEDQWHGEFKDMLDNIPADACLTIVDCHI